MTIAATLLCLLLMVISMWIHLSYWETTVPSISSSWNFAGLKNEVKVSRDNNGIIHLEAQDEMDLFFAQGVVAAQERLFQMELQKRTAEGTLRFNLLFNLKYFLQQYVILFPFISLGYFEDIS